MSFIELGEEDGFVARPIVTPERALQDIRSQRASETPPTPAAPTTTVASAALEISHILGEATQSITGEDADDLLDLVDHGYADGDRVKFTALTGGSSLAAETRYFVIAADEDTFQISDEPGGDALDFGSNITAATITRMLPLDTSHLEVHVGTASGFTPSQTTYVGQIPAGSSLQNTTLNPVVRAYIEDSADRYVKVVAVNFSGKVSAASAQTGPHNVTGGGDLVGNWNGLFPLNLAEPNPRQWLSLDGSGYATTPDVPTFDATGDLSLGFAGNPSGASWRPSSDAMLVGKWGASGTYSYRLLLLTDGTLRLQWSTDGTTTSTSADSTTAVSSTGVFAVGASLDVDNGAAGRDIKFYYRDIGGAWTQLGSTVTQAGTTSVFSGTATPSIGADATGSDAFVGDVYWGRLWDVVITFTTHDFADQADLMDEVLFYIEEEWPDDGPNGTPFSWTLQGTGTIEVLTGYGLDSSEGAAEFAAGISLGGDLVFMGGGVVSKDTLPYVKFGGASDGVNYIWPFNQGMTFESGNPDELVPGFIGFTYTGSGASSNIIITTPTIDDTTDEFMDFQIWNTTNPKGITITANGVLTNSPEFRFGSETGYPWRLILRNGDLDSYIVSDAADQLNFYAGGVELLRLVESTNDQVYLPNAGSAAAPGLAIGALDVGFYYTGAGDQLSVVTEGTARFRWDTAGDYRSESGTGAARLAYAVGDATAPAFNFVGDTDSGMYRDSANVVGIATAGAARVLISASAFTYGGSTVHTNANHVSAVATAHTHGTSEHNGMAHTGHKGGTSASAGDMVESTSAVWLKGVASTFEIKEGIAPLLNEPLPSYIPKKRIGKRSDYGPNPVLDLIPVWFYSQPDAERGRTLPYAGLVAEQVEEVFPEAYRPGSWDVNIVVSALLAKVKEQEQRIAQLEGARG